MARLEGLESSQSTSPATTSERWTPRPSHRTRLGHPSSIKKSFTNALPKILTMTSARNVSASEISALALLTERQKVLTFAHSRPLHFRIYRVGKLGI